MGSSAQRSLHHGENDPVSRMVIQVVQALFVLFITVDSTISVVLEKVFRVRRTGLGTEEMKGGIQG